MTPQTALPNPLEHMRRRIGALPSPTNQAPGGRNGPAPALPSPSRRSLDVGDYEARVGAVTGQNGMAPPSGAMSRALPNPYTQAETQSRNPLLSAAMSGFMRGYNPEQWQSDQDRQKSEGVEKGKKLLALAQQQRSIPEAQRAQWWQANAPMIGQLTGVDTSQPVDPSQFSDAALDGHIAALTGQLGIVSDPMSEYQKAQLAQKEAELGRPKPPIEVNGRLVDPDTYEVLGDYSDPDKGEAITPYQQAQLDLAREKFEFDKTKPAGGGAMTPYQQFQTERAVRQDEQKVKDKQHERTVRTNNLNEGIGLVEQLIEHPGFQELYGWSGAVPVVPGSAPKLPGTKGANAESVLEQIGGQAFLAGVESMRGTGPLSDREGQAVKAARTRLLNRNQSDESARQAAAEFIGSMVRLKRAYDIESGKVAARSPEEYLNEAVTSLLPSSVRTMMPKSRAQQQPQDDIDPEIESLLNEAFGADEPEARLSPDEEDELRQLEAEFGRR